MCSYHWDPYIIHISKNITNNEAFPVRFFFREFFLLWFKNTPRVSSSINHSQYIPLLFPCSKCCEFYRPESEGKRKRPSFVVCLHSAFSPSPSVCYHYRVVRLRLAIYCFILITECTLPFQIDNLLSSNGQIGHQKQSFFLKTSTSHCFNLLIAATISTNLSYRTYT